MSEPKLLKRQARADGTLVLSTRRDASSPWIEICRAASNNPAAMADMNKRQSAFNTPLVREVFLELTEEKDFPFSER